MTVDDAWLSPAVVAEHLKVSLGAGGELPAGAELARAAAAEFVADNRRDLFPEDGAPVVGPRVVLGSALLAARLYARRSSPAGLASFGEFGPAAVLREDADVARLLGLARYARPRIG